MASRTWQAIAVLLLLGPASLAGKLLTLDQPHPASMAAAESTLPGEMVAVLAAGDLERAGRRRMLNMPGYAAEVYRQARHARQPHQCSGVVYIMTMLANAEASTLLRHPGTLPIADSFFVFQGQLFDAYPGFKQWLAHWNGRIHTLFGQHSKLPIVYGVASTATCMRARTLPWHRLAY